MPLTRREFIGQTGVFIAASTSVARALTPNEKLNIGFIGVAGRGGGNLAGLSIENVAALCDVDERRLGKAAEKHPKAKTWLDYRKMIDEQKDLDAIVVSTPDHHHAPAIVRALRAGKHVYSEKPLVHEVHEARVVRKLAAERKVVTQMGNQLHSMENIIRPVELVMSGALGAVREVHCWSAKIFAPGDRPKETPKVPAHLNWDLWLGPAPERPYHPKYVPFYWRGWWDFGCGNLGDMACHIMDTAFWSLQLGYPETVEVEGPEPHPESAPEWRIARWTFPARGAQPPVVLTWHNARQPGPEIAEGEKLPRQGSILVGEKGKMLVSHSRGLKLFPAEKFKDFEEPRPLLRRPKDASHHRDFLDAIKDGRRAGSHFEYGGMMTETALLANVAFRVGKKLEWDGHAMKATNCAEADRFIRREYRKGWTL